jgi:hypothetical protein
MKFKCVLISAFLVFFISLSVSTFPFCGLSWAQGGEVFFFSNFEGSNGGLYSTRDWEWGNYAWNGTGDCTTEIAPPSAHSGTGMWGTILNGCYNGLGNNQGYSDCNNTGPGDDSVLSFTVDLRDTSSAYLSWWEWYDLFSVWDWAEVYVNGEVVFQHCEPSYVIPTAWERQVVDISSYTGATVTIEFHMMASTVVNKSGWYLDDIAVTSLKGNVPTGNYLLLLGE